MEDETDLLGCAQRAAIAACRRAGERHHLVTGGETPWSLGARICVPLNQEAAGHDERDDRREHLARRALASTSSAIEWHRPRLLDLAQERQQNQEEAKYKSGQDPAAITYMPSGGCGEPR